MRSLAGGLLTALIVVAPGLGGCQPGCVDLTVAAAGTPSIVQGMAPASGTLCYRLATNKGDQVRVQVTSGGNVMVSIDGVADGRDDVSFSAKGGPYVLKLAQLMRATAPQAFTLRISAR